MSDETNQAILVELRRLRRALYVIAIFVVVVSLPAFFTGFKRGLSRGSSWDEVTTAMKRQDFSAALSMARALVAAQPNYYYGHSYLGAIYLAMGDVTNAEAHYTRAYELFPNEESEKDLAAVRKRKATGGDFKLLTK